MEQSPEVSVVIVCMNRPDLLYPCLDSIKAHTSASYEVLVVAYRFSAGNLEGLREAYPWVTIVPSDATRGFAENNNLALRQAQGRFCFILNDDTELTGPVIDRLLADFDRLPGNTAVVSPRHILEDGSVQYAGRTIPPAWKYVFYTCGIGKIEQRNATAISPTGNLSGAAFLIRTDVFRKAGWFDEIYFFSPEDMALSRWLTDNGFVMYVDPEVDVIHKWRQSSGPIMKAVRPALVRGHLIFYFGGKGPECTLAGLLIWLVFSAKWFWSAVRGRSLAARTFANVARAALSRKTPKELFELFM